MALFNFITVRLGKDSIPDINKICESEVGVLDETFTINVKCTQVPDNYGYGDYAFLWLGSDNNKGMPTQWKQGFKAVGRVKGVNRGSSYNDISETKIDIVYVESYKKYNKIDDGDENNYINYYLNNYARAQQMNNINKKKNDGCTCNIS